MKVAMVTCIEVVSLTVYSDAARQDVETQPAHENKGQDNGSSDDHVYNNDTEKRCKVQRAVQVALYVVAMWVACPNKGVS